MKNIKIALVPLLIVLSNTICASTTLVNGKKSQTKTIIDTSKDNVKNTSNDQIRLYTLVPPQTNKGSNVFGFPEFIASLAIFIVVYSASDFRTRFRVAVAIIPLKIALMWLMFFVCALTITSSYWYENGFYVPKMFEKKANLEILIGAAFALTSLAWICIAYIFRPSFSKWNCHHFAQAFFSTLLKGAESEIIIVAEEIQETLPKIIKAASMEQSKYSDCANDILSCFGDQRFTKCVALYSPATAIIIAEEISKCRNYNLPVSQFFRNLTFESVLHSESLVYRENSSYESGMIGRLKYFKTKIYGNYSLIDGISTSQLAIYDLEIFGSSNFDAKKIKTYCELLLETIADYLKTTGPECYSKTISHAIRDLSLFLNSVHNLSKNSAQIEFENVRAKFISIINFIHDLNYSLEKIPSSKLSIARMRGYSTEFYDSIASLIFEMLLLSEYIDTNYWSNHTLQTLIFWDCAFGSTNKCDHWDAVCYRIRRKIYDEICNLNEIPNYKSARILRACLKLLPFEMDKKTQSERRVYAIQKATINWVKWNFLKLYSKNPHIAKFCMHNQVTLSRDKKSIVKSFIHPLNKKENKTFIHLE